MLYKVCQHYLRTFYLCLSVEEIIASLFTFENQKYYFFHRLFLGHVPWPMNVIQGLDKLCPNKTQDYCSKVTENINIHLEDHKN